MGAPVFARRFATRPLAIESCIEVSDSLRDGFSYFYAEVRRLKALLDATRARPSLFLIDEIFRGTNNRERQIGSRAVIETLAQAQGSEGFVSTHDLELTSLEGEHVVNLHFREEISPVGEMTFTYRLQKGASPTTNALRIMQLEGLPVAPF
jgi:DNA mismatch repair ATPase MutS